MTTRALLIGVSLKMYFSHAETLRWCTRVAEVARDHPAIADGSVEFVVLPSHPSLAAVGEIFGGTPVRVGAQDVFWEDCGPFTGEVSGVQLAELGCAYAEVGHAERRRLFGEDDAVVAAKTAAALRNGLAPIICVGEEERVPAAEAAEFCVRQLDDALADARKAGRTGPIVAAYEPVWAIGADEPAGVGHISEVTRALGARVAQDAGNPGRVIYGGSAGPGLLGRLGENVDGLFLGRFAHSLTSLASILDEAR